MPPLRYCFSSALLLPKKLMINLFTCPLWVRRASPPTLSIPALLDTAVNEFNESVPRLCSAWISVSATPQRPKPALRIVEPDCTSATASSALSNSFDLDRSIVGALSATALMLRICFVNRQCGGATRAARNCEGIGRRAHSRAGKAASSRYDEGRASIVRCRVDELIAQGLQTTVLFTSFAASGESGKIC